MTILELSKKRFSARKYTDEPVSKEDLHYLLEVTRMAPSAVNKQPWKFVIVKSEEARKKHVRSYRSVMIVNGSRQHRFTSSVCVKSRRTGYDRKTVSNTAT